MSRANIFVGLEIGTSKICAIVGEAKPDGSVRILGVGQVPSRGVRKGEIVDFETASQCVKDAIADAEEKSDVTIGNVYLAISGSHISSFNNRGSIVIPEDQDEIEEQDLDSVRAAAAEVSIPSQNSFMHSILQHYYVDGQENVLKPVGLLGRTLDADFHIVHGIRNRIQNTIRCVKELDIEVDDVVFSPLAAAQVVIDQNQKNLGALLIDIGGGTSDYILYVNGAVKQSGTIALGGDHITNDISMGLHLPIARAEKLKVEEGSVILGNCRPGETVALKDESRFVGKEVEREMLNTIINLRVRETFELLKRKLQQQENYLDYLGAGIFITGGCSMLRGIDHLAEEVFDVPVHIGRAQSMAGVTSAVENPQFSTAIGLIKYAQAVALDKPRGFFGKLKQKLPRFLSLFLFFVS